MKVDAHSSDHAEDIRSRQFPKPNARFEPHRISADLWYFETHHHAKDYACRNVKGFPAWRIVEYTRGHAIQLRPGGPYVGQNTDRLTGFDIVEGRAKVDGPIPKCRECGEETTNNRSSSFFGSVHRFGPRDHEFKS
jgi:hypothetical protein